MLMYYLLIVVNALPEHWLFATKLGGLTITKWIGLLTILVAVMAIPMRRNTGSGPRAAMLAFFAYYSIMMISCLVRGPGLSMHGDFTKLLSILATFLVVMSFTDTATGMERALKVFAVAIAFSSNYVIRQFFQFHDVYRGWRSPGASGDPNYYALMVVIWLPVCFFLLARAKSLEERFLYIGCTAFSLLGFILAASRGGLLGLVAAVLWMIFRSQKRLQLFLAAFVLILPPLLLLPASPVRRMMEPLAGDVRATENRLVLWKAAWALYRDHPVAGVGTIGFKGRLQEYEDPSRPLPFTAVHNTYLEAGALWGTFGLGTFLLMNLLLFRALGKIGQRKPATLLTGLAPPFQAGLIGFAVGAVFVSTWWFMMYWFLIFLSFALVRLANTKADESVQPTVIRPRESPAPRARPRVPGPVAIQRRAPIRWTRGEPNSYD